MTRAGQILQLDTVYRARRERLQAHRRELLAERIQLGAELAQLELDEQALQQRRRAWEDERRRWQGQPGLLREMQRQTGSWRELQAIEELLAARRAVARDRLERLASRLSAVAQSMVRVDQLLEALAGDRAAIHRAAQASALRRSDDEHLERIALEAAGLDGALQ